MTRTALACILASFALPLACGGGGQATNPPTTPSPTETSSASAGASAVPTETSAATASAEAAAAPPGPPGPGDWDKWTHDQKMAYMKHTVMAKEHDLFAGFDATKFASMNCKTCHGSGAADGSFKMPSPDLPVLPAPDGLMAEAKKKPKMFEFMAKQVEPQTAALLGMQPYDPKTNSGFGCYNCHTHT